MRIPAIRPGAAMPEGRLPDGSEILELIGEALAGCRIGERLR
ncbi:hypothetical protein AB0C13_12230 [Streptomyces sp. NPDC049099]